MDRNRPIGILDSGVGGLTVFRQTERLLPTESVVYIGDTKRMPYGNRTPEEIIRYANRMIAFLEEEGVKAVLLACNTISSYIDRLESNVPLFSIVKAGSEFAVNKSRADESELVGLIATKATVDAGSYDRTIHSMNPKIEIVANDSTRLPKVIDSQIENRPLLDSLIKDCIQPIMDENPKVRNLILGCSHFPIIEKEINEIYPELTLLDPAEQMVYNLRDYLAENRLICSQRDGRKSLYTTADILEFVSYIKRLSIKIDKLEKIKLFSDD